MTSLRARPLSRLLTPCLLGVLALCLSPLLSPRPAYAGEDDFEYGQALAKMGASTGDNAFFDYARRVFNKVINDESRSEVDKDLCRYGLAEMKRNEAIGATGNLKIPYKDVLALFNEAVATMEEFVEKNPEHKKTNEAKLLVGTTRLAFVQWARDALLEDPETAGERNANPTDVQRDAENMVRGAIKYFDGLREGFDRDKPPPTPTMETAQYYWVLCQYYLTLVFESNSNEARNSLEAAAKHLDDFITLNDGKLLAVYAQDIFGLTRWEQAKNAETEAEKEDFYRKAVMWFGTCVDSEVYGPLWEIVIANGYLHIGKCCREAGRVGKTNFTKIGINYLSEMEDRFPTVARKQPSCIRALIEWAHLEYGQDHGTEAVAIAERAGEYGKALGSGWLENLSGRALREFIGGKRSGGVTSANPDVLMRVADNFYNEKKWTEAIGAYQQVLAATERTKSNIDSIIRAWERISASYRQLGDLMACALSLEPVHAIWVDGLVEKVGGPDDPNMIRLGNIRRRAMQAWKDLYTLAGSPVYRKRNTEIRDSFSSDYPEHPSGRAGDWNSALEKYNEAIDQRRDGNDAWKQTIRKSEPLFRKVARDLKSDKLDAALLKLIYIPNLLKDWAGVQREVKAAQKFWASKASQDQIKQFPTIAAERKKRTGQAIVWLAESFYAQEKWDEVLKTLDGWRSKYGDVVDAVGRVDFKSRALGHLVQAWIGKGDIEKANGYYRKLLKEDPGYGRLAKISFALAEHFNSQAREIDKGRAAALGKLNGTKEPPTVGAKRKFRDVDRDLGRAQGRLGDVVAARNTAQRAIDLLADLKKKDEHIPPSLPPQVEEAKKKIPGLDAEIKRLQEKVNRLGSERQTLEKEVTDLTAEVMQAAQELYEPLVTAAGYYWDWDQALIQAEHTREAKNVLIFAGLYFKAGLLRPEVAENWARAQSLFEDYLKMPDAVKESKQESLGDLGTIYSRLAAAAEPGSEQRAQLVAKALNRLQASLSTLPENNDLVVGLLKGDVVVIPWRRRPGDPLYRFPLPRVESVEEFRRVVASMGTPTGPKMPKFETEAENKSFEDGIKFFKLHVEQLSEAQLKGTVKDFAKAGFDMGFYKAHAEWSAKFRLALAWIYSESGEFDHMTKGYNLASSLVYGRSSAEEDSADWWEAQVIRLRAIVAGAELQSKASPASAPSPIVKDWTDRASDLLRGLNTSSPGLGDDSRPETRDELKALNQRIETLRARSGLSPLNLMLDPIAAPSSGDGDKGGDEKEGAGDEGDDKKGDQK